MHRSPRKIFVVEDDEPIRRALTLLIRSFGWPVRAFACGSACLCALALERPDCIVTDLDLPGMNGIQMVEVLAEQGIHIPIIIVTGAPSGSSLVEEARSVGAAAILQTPFSEQDLQKAVTQVITGEPGLTTW